MHSVLFRSLLPVWLLFSAPLMALKAPDQGAPAVDPDKASRPPAVEPETEPRGTVKQPAAARPTNGGFVPSERIKADSAVSFPVDI